MAKDLRVLYFFTTIWWLSRLLHPRSWGSRHRLQEDRSLFWQQGLFFQRTDSIKYHTKAWTINMLRKVSYPSSFFKVGLLLKEVAFVGIHSHLPFQDVEDKKQWIDSFSTGPWLSFYLSAVPQRNGIATVMLCLWQLNKINPMKKLCTSNCKYSELEVSITEIN